MANKFVVITGGSSGIGRAAALRLASLGHRVALTARTTERAERAAADICAAVAGDRLDDAPEVSGHALDLADFSSIRSFAATLHEHERRIDVLIHNAGAVFPKRQTTVDGHEAQLQIIWLGPSLLTRLLLPQLATPGARLVQVVSDLHRQGTVDFGDLELERGYGFLKAYRRAELLKLLETYELARRLAPDVTVNAVHPGGVRTELFREFRGPLGWLWWLSGWLKATPAAGASGLLHLAESAEVEGTTGCYFVGRRQRRSSSASLDQRLQAEAKAATDRLLAGA